MLYRLFERGHLLLHMGREHLISIPGSRKLAPFECFWEVVPVRTRRQPATALAGLGSSVEVVWMGSRTPFESPPTSGSRSLRTYTTLFVRERDCLLYAHRVADGTFARQVCYSHSERVACYPTPGWLYLI